MSPGGTPYVSFSDESVEYKLSVMKFDGVSWVYVGTPGASSGLIEYTSMAFSPGGKPYVAFEDYGEEGKAALMKFDGTNWTNVGEEGFTSAEADFTSLAFSPDGTPHIAFEDYSQGGRATVMKYDSVYSGMGEEQQSHISVFPNPAADFITIALPCTLDKPVKAEITDISGRKIMTSTITLNRTKLSLRELPPGFYNIRIASSQLNLAGKFFRR
jgi:hypothetical protein